MWRRVQCGDEFGVATSSVWRRGRCGDQFGVATSSVYPFSIRGPQFFALLFHFLRIHNNLKDVLSFADTDKKNIWFNTIWHNLTLDF